MHYYQFNVADYRKDTVHLTPTEHYVYRTLIDWYYLDETPIPIETDWVLRRLRLGFDNEENLLNVLTDFFKKESDGWHHVRIDNEIVAYHANAIKNKANGMLGGRPKKTQSVTFGLPDETQVKGNQELITNNHKPSSKGNRLPKDWQPSAEYIDFCKKNRPDLKPEFIAEEFKDYWISVAGAKGIKLDWFATWRNWVRNQRLQSLVAGTSNNNAWRNDDVAILKKAKELNVHTSGKTKYEILALIDKKQSQLVAA